jgi:hypothetical protein
MSFVFQCFSAVSVTLRCNISDWMINKSDVIIIDIDNKEMVKIAEQALGIGWIR